MRNRQIPGILFLLMALIWPGVGCAKPSPEPKRQTQAQPEAEFVFPKGSIRLGGKTLKIEYANTPALRERGLMFRESLPEDHGMLFIFPGEEKLAFWMKNTLIPLSIGYFDKSKRLIDVQEMTPAAIGDRLPPSYPSKHPAQYALEMPKGWFERNKVGIGAAFVIITGP
jgi:uncharacterized protein